MNVQNHISHTKKEHSYFRYIVVHIISHRKLNTLQVNSDGVVPLHLNHPRHISALYLIANLLFWGTEWYELTMNKLLLHIEIYSASKSRSPLCEET